MRLWAECWTFDLRTALRVLGSSTPTQRPLPPRNLRLLGTGVPERPNPRSPETPEALKPEPYVAPNPNPQNPKVQALLRSALLTRASPHKSSAPAKQSEACRAQYMQIEPSHSVGSVEKMRKPAGIPEHPNRLNQSKCGAGRSKVHKVLITHRVSQS